MKPRYAIKFLPKNRKACFGHGLREPFTYPEPGVWTTRRKPKPCRTGFHAVRTMGGANTAIYLSRLSRWSFYGDTAWLVEVRYGIRYDTSKICAGQMRLIQPLISRKGERWAEYEFDRVVALAQRESAKRGGVLL